MAAQRLRSSFVRLPLDFAPRLRSQARPGDTRSLSVLQTLQAPCLCARPTRATTRFLGACDSASRPGLIIRSGTHSARSFSIHSRLRAEQPKDGAERSQISQSAADLSKSAARDPKAAAARAKSKVTQAVEQLKAATGKAAPVPLSENIYTLPNLLTTLRLLSVPVVGHLVLTSQMPAAAALLFVSGCTDVLDGWLARKYNSYTVFGSIADPAADKALMTVMVVCLAIKGLLPVPLAVIILGRDLALVISAFLIRYRSLPPPKTFARYWDFSLPSASVQPTQISKYNTFLQLLLVGAATVVPCLPPDVQSLAAIQNGMTAFQFLVAGTTIWSGASYVFGKGAVKYLHNK